MPYLKSLYFQIPSSMQASHTLVSVTGDYDQEERMPTLIIYGGKDTDEEESEAEMETDEDGASGIFVVIVVTFLRVDRLNLQRISHEHPMAKHSISDEKHMSRFAETSQSLPAIQIKAGLKDSKPSLPDDWAFVSRNRIFFLPVMKKLLSKPENDAQDISKQLIQSSEVGFPN
ncbi:hypothetical protein DsansV1_C02g0014941 [Dioscorea sansibarensis]